MRVRLLTYNAGQLKMLRRSVPTPYVSERITHLPAEIRKLDADIVLLQEIYDEATRRSVAKTFNEDYPYAVLPHARRRFGLANGLMTLSRFPTTSVITLFRDAPIDEAWFDSKGLLTTTHTLPSGVDLHCINLHTTAGGLFSHPESTRIDSVRALQIEQVLKHQKDLTSLVIIAGDLNAGPGVSDSNFRQIINAGFVSLHDFLHGEVSEPTWDPSNPLNIDGPHKHCPPQRIDHVFVRKEDIADARVTPISSVICLKDPAVPLTAHKNVSVSDHYGLVIELEIVSIASSIATP